MGSRASFHSFSPNRASRAEPRVSIAITIGLEVWNWVPMPDMGMSRRMMPEELSTMPGQSILASFVFNGSGGMVWGGSRKYRATAMQIANGEMKKNVARQLTLRVKPAAMKGPTELPSPTQDPRIPWYLLHTLDPMTNKKG